MGIPNEGSGKYNHLLKPIRDLAQNWNIDLATDLEDYLEELENISICFDDNSNESGMQNLNFAQAALLIQGSTDIYSRKVEYLYSLVFQTLDQLSTSSNNSNNESQQQHSENVGGEGNQSEDEEDQLEEDYQEAYMLSECSKLPEAKNITINVNSSKTKTKNSIMNSDGRNYQASIALMGSLIPDERDRGESFKMTSCYIHSSGALLMEEQYKDFLNIPEKENVTQSGSNRNPEINNDFTIEVATINNEKMDVDYNETEEDNNCSFEQNNSLDYPVENSEKVEELNNDEAINDYEDDNGEYEEDINGDNDPWQPLDPYDTSYAKPKPFRKGKTFRTNNKRKSETSPPDDIYKSFYDELKIDKMWMKSGILMTKDFQSIWTSQLQMRRKEMLKVLAQSKTSNTGNGRVRNNLSADEEIEMEDDYTWGMGDEMGDETEEIADFDNADGIEVNNEPELDSINLSSAFNDVSSTPDTNETYKNNQYEDLCRAHIEAFMKGADKYAKETNLSKQVGIWQGKLEPILKEQDSHRPFDIHECSDRILSALENLEINTENEKEKSATVKKDSFEKIVEGLPQYEICRMFLASLQLANNGNVELIHGGKASEQIQVPFALNLLTTENCYESIQ